MTGLTASLFAFIFAACLAVAGPTPHKPANYGTWLKIARCESDSEWHIVGGGYYGGLQFDATSWTSEDVERFAVTANLATERQQMIVANRLFKAQGWNAWPVCSYVAGAR